MGLLTIRPIVNKDIPAVIKIWETCELLVPWNDPLQDIKLKMDFQPELFFVGEAEDHVWATLMAGYEGHRGWINYLAVVPEVRGRGYGRCMMEHALAKLRELGCPKVNLMIRKSNMDKLGFYRKLGFLEDDIIGLGYRF